MRMKVNVCSIYYNPTLAPCGQTLQQTRRIFYNTGAEFYSRVHLHQQSTPIVRPLVKDVNEPVLSHHIFYLPFFRYNHHPATPFITRPFFCFHQCDSLTDMYSIGQHCLQLSFKFFFKTDKSFFCWYCFFFFF